MSGQIAHALEDAAKKAEQGLAKDFANGYHDILKETEQKTGQVADHVAENEAKTVEDIGKASEHGKPEVTGPHPAGGGASPTPRGEEPGGSGRDRVSDPREAGRPPDAVCEGGEPVDMATGRMFIEQTDVYLPGALALLFNRSFESGYRAGRWMGPRWVCTFDERLEIDAEGVVYLGADRMAQAFPHPTPDEPAQASAGARWSLSTAPGTGDYTLTDPGTGLVREFSVVPGGREALLTRLRDRSGHHVEFTYDTNGAPLSMRHSGGYQLLVTVDGGRISSLRLAGADEDGNDALLTRYQYTDGHLTSVFNSSGRPLRFANDARGRVVSWTDRNGTQYHYSYDQLDRVVEEAGTDGSLSFRFDYGAPDPDTGIKVHSETNALGHTTRHYVNEHAQVVAQTDPLGNTTLFERDEFDRLLSRTDPLGRTIRFAYDGAGDLVSVTRPDGEQSTATYAGSLSLPIVLTRPGGRAWHYTYDESGSRTSVTDPTGATTRYGYDESGHLASVTDAVGQCTLVRCNPAGLPVEVTDPGGATSSYRRDAFGRVVEVTDQLGAVTRLTWTTEGRLASFTAPDGTIETWTYDDEGNLLVHTDQLGQASAFEYTPFETIAARTAPDGTRLSFSYDADMRLVAVTNTLGQRWSYTYDAAGGLVGERDFHGRSVSYQLDAAGQIIARTNPLGQRIAYDYDLLGRVVAKNAAGETTRYRYDAAGHLLQATSPDAELHRVVDPLGNLLAETVNGHSLSFTRDKVGRRTGRTTPRDHTSLWSYNEAGRHSSLSTSGGRLDFAYDAAGHEAERVIGRQLALVSTWNTEHRLTSQTLRTDESVLQRRDYAYRDDGALIGIEDQVTGPRALELDSAGRVTTVQAADWSERYAYDPAGNLTDADWPASGATSAALGTRTYTGTELTTAGRVRYEYDAAGRTVLRQVTRLSRKPDTWRYTWDAEDRLTHVSTPDGTRWRYRYDPFGRRIAKQRLAEDGTTVVEQTDFTWDGAVLAEQTTHAPYLPGPHTLSWDHRGLHPLAQTETITTPATAESPQDQMDRRFFAIVTDLVGTPTELVDPAAGTIAWRATRTVWGHTTWPAASTTYTPLRFPGQYFDPETRLHYNLNRYYDPETARYTTPDPLGLTPDPNPDSYVHNPYTWADPLGLAPDPSDDLRKELLDLGKSRVDKVAEGLGDDDPTPGAYTVGKDRTTGKIYYGESGPATGHEKAVADAMPTESHHPSGRPPGCCGEPRMLTNAIKDGADPKNIDMVTVNPKGKKFKMCSNCQTWVPGFGGGVLSG